MRKRFCLLLIALSVLGSGCSLVTDATCLTLFTVREAAEEFSESIRNRRWAESAWEDAQRTDPHKTYSEDYARGFKDGFEYYLFRGGNGEPPPLPPSRYRKLRYQTPQGYKAIEDWFAGFRQGAVAARLSGNRQWITGPSALRGPGSGPDLVPPPPGAEPETVSLERPVPLEMAPRPTPAPSNSQAQRSSTRPAPPAAKTLPSIINGDATPLPKIINGEPRSLPPAG